MGNRVKDGGPAFAVAMAMDAFRICIGMAPVNFSAADIGRWFEINRAMLAQRDKGESQ